MAKRSKRASSPTDAPGVAGKSVVLNGGTTGIGLATAKLLATYGARVLIFGRERDCVDEAVEQSRVTGGEVFGVTGDVTRQGDVVRLFKEADKRFGGVDILINNAAAAGHSLLDSEYDDWRKLLDTNILGYLQCAREALDRMRPRKDGHVLMVGSMSANLREPGGDIYAATKAAVQALCEALRKNVNEKGVRVILIEPGAVDTPIQTKPRAAKDRKKQKMEMLEPEDIAESIYYVLTQPKRCDVVMVQIRPLKQLI
jgi:NADP-dependent 3-hydroxy acid dehydrogenase YdfG